MDMIDQRHLDIRTITMGISSAGLLRSGFEDVPAIRFIEKITRCAKDLVKTGEDIEQEFGIPIVNKRISVTPMAPWWPVPARRRTMCPLPMALDAGGQDLRRQLHRRLFRSGAEGLHRRRTEKLIRSIPGGHGPPRSWCAPA